jgi:hypothetical protein
VSSSWEFLLTHSDVVLSAMMKNTAIDAVDQLQNYTIRSGEYKSTNEAYFKIFFCKFFYKILLLNFFRILIMAAYKQEKLDFIHRMCIFKLCQKQNTLKLKCNVPNP